MVLVQGLEQAAIGRLHAEEHHQAIGPGALHMHIAARAAGIVTGGAHNMHGLAVRPGLSNVLLARQYQGGCGCQVAMKMAIGVGRPFDQQVERAEFGLCRQHGHGIVNRVVKPWTALEMGPFDLAGIKMKRALHTASGPCHCGRYIPVGKSNQKYPVDSINHRTLALMDRPFVARFDCLGRRGLGVRRDP